MIDRGQLLANILGLLSTRQHHLSHRGSLFAKRRINQVSRILRLVGSSISFAIVLILGFLKLSLGLTLDVSDFTSDSHPRSNTTKHDPALNWSVFLRLRIEHLNMQAHGISLGPHVTSRGWADFES